MEWLKEHWFRAGALLVSLLAIGLIAYYFMAFVPQQEAAQQQAAQTTADLEKNTRAVCVVQAQRLAISEYEHSIVCTGSYAPQDCSDGSTYLIAPYNSAYQTCLQSNGLQ